MSKRGATTKATSNSVRLLATKDSIGFEYLGARQGRVESKDSPSILESDPLSSCLKRVASSQVVPAACEYLWRISVKPSHADQAFRSV